MKTRLVFALVALGVGSVWAWAQGGVTGRWTGETQGRGGTQQVSLDLAVDRNTLTGTFTQGGQSGPIENGTVDGNNISFSRTVNTPNGNFTINFTGTVDGDVLTLTPQFPAGGRGGRGGRGGGPQPFTLTRER